MARRVVKDRATVYRLSPTLDAIVYGRGAVVLMRGRTESLILNDAEAASLATALADAEAMRAVLSSPPDEAARESP